MKKNLCYILLVSSSICGGNFSNEESDRCKEVKELYNLFCSPEESNSERCVRFQDFVESICNQGNQ